MDEASAGASTNIVEGGQNPVIDTLDTRKRLLKFDLDSYQPLSMVDELKDLIFDTGRVE